KHNSITDRNAVADRDTSRQTRAEQEDVAITDRHAGARHNAVANRHTVTDGDSISDRHTEIVNALVLRDQIETRRIATIQENALRPWEGVTIKRRRRCRRNY